DLGGVFDLLGFRTIPGNVGDGVDNLAGFNCQAIVLEVPISMLTKDGSNPMDPDDPAAIIGMWASTRRDSNDGRALSRTKQISRLGMPLVNEVVLPLGQKDRFNASRPFNDAQFASYVLDPELARAINALYGVSVPPAPRCDLVAAFLTGIPGLNQPPDVRPAEMIRLNVTIKPDGEDSRFGVLAGDLDGFPNGRRLFDDVVDIEERVVAGVIYPAFCDPSYVPDPLAAQLGDGVDRNDVDFRADFPYLASPHQGWDHDHQRIEPSHPPMATPPAHDMETLLSGAVSRGDTWGPRDVASDASTALAFGLGASSPNPAPAGSKISFQLPQTTAVSLAIFDVGGRKVRTLVEGTLDAGAHTASWDGKDDAGRSVESGVYLYKLSTPESSAQRKLVVMQ
ncbi:MAG: DUF4331 family protein, partial [Candidatus Eisenbacteria bacterium]